MNTETRLVGLAELAHLFGITKQGVANWRSRYTDFPTAAAELKSGPVWQRDPVLRWAEEHAIPTPGVEELPADGDAETGKPHRCATVALVNMKGGVGKSTLTYNLGAYCAYIRGLRVLLVDLDPQFNLSQYALGVENYEQHLKADKKTIVDVFEKFSVARRGNGLKPADAIVPVATWYSGKRRLDLVPSHLNLAWTAMNPQRKEQLLDIFLDEVRASYDLILVDCPPTESMLTSAAYLASDYVLVPVKPEFLSTIGLPLLTRSLDEFRITHKGTEIELLGIVFNDTGTKAEHSLSRQFVAKIANDENWYVFKNEVTHSDSYPAGSRLGKPIFRTGYARGWKIRDFNAVADEFVARLGL